MTVRRPSRLLIPCAYFLVASSLVAAPPSTRPVEGLRENPPAVHALTNARIVTSPGSMIDKGTLVVRDGVIVAVGEQVVVPQDARVWDLQGKTVYAGLIDAYSPVAAVAPSGGAGYWNSLVTPELSLAGQYKPDSTANEKLRKQGVAYRLVVPETGIIKGQSVLASTSADAGEHAIVRADVAQHLQLGIPRSRSRGGYPSSPMGAVALARQAFLDADWYGKAWSAYQSQSSLPRPENNDALAALQAAIRDHQMFVIDAANELYFLRADAFAREFSIHAIVRGSGQEYQRLEAIRGTGRPVIVPVNFPRPPAVHSPEAILDAEIEDLLHWDLAPENPARLEKAGVQIAFTSDGLRDLDEFLTQIRVAVERGLPADAALRALTVTPAELFQVDRHLGTIAVGKLASFVVTDGELFDKKTKITETWIAGRRYEIQPDPSKDIRGTWEVRVGDQELVLKANVTGTPDKLQGTVELPQPGKDSKSVKIAKLAFRDQKLTGSLPAKELDAKQSGTVQFSGVLLAAEQGEWTISGTAIDATGANLIWHARRIAGHEDTPSKEPQDSEKKKKKQKAKKKKQAESSKSKDASDSSKAKQDSGKAASGSSEVAEDRRPAKASFEVNYPLGAFGRTVSVQRPTIVLFRNATIWTCGPQGVIENGSLLVQDGKIAAVGGADLEAPQDATIVDVAGKHISPGIIDCHSHMATDGGVNEATQAITAEVRVGDFIDCDDIDIYRQLAGGVTTSNILHGSANPIGGQNQVIKLRWGELFDAMRFAEAPPGIKFALGENVKRSNFVDESTRYPQSRMGVEQIIRDAFQAAREYREQWRRWEQHHDTLPPRRDLELETLLEIVDGKRWVHCHSYRQDEILALLRTCEEFGIRIATLQHILEGYKVADAIARHGAMGSSFSDWWAYKIEVYDAIPYNGALMHNAGVVVSFNSDDQELARHLNHEAAKAMKYGGIPAEEALKFVTLNPAKQLRVDSMIGSLEPGKHADLVVWSGPPLAVTSRCEQSWIDGKKYFDRDEDRELRQQATKIRATLVQKILASGETPRSSDQSSKQDEELWPREDIYCRARQR